MGGDVKTGSDFKSIHIPIRESVIASIQVGVAPQEWASVRRGGLEAAARAAPSMEVPAAAAAAFCGTAHPRASRECTCE